MNPLQEMQLLRNAMHDGKTTNMAAFLIERDRIEVHVDEVYHNQATALLTSLLRCATLTTFGVHFPCQNLIKKWTLSDGWVG